MKKIFTLIAVALMAVGSAFAEKAEPDGLRLSFKDSSAESLDCLFVNAPKIQYSADGTQLTLTTTTAEKTYNLADIKKMEFVTLDPSGIQIVEGTNAKTQQAYDLQGRKIQDIKSATGVVVVNGKKTLIIK